VPFGAAAIAWPGITLGAPAVPYGAYPWPTASSP
jgi:hypothetical protein